MILLLHGARILSFVSFLSATGSDHLSSSYVFFCKILWSVYD